MSILTVNEPLEVAMIDISRYRAVLFDLDGTLIDYRGAQEHAARRIMEATGLEETSGSLNRLMDFLDGRTVQDIAACKPSAMDPASNEMRQTFRRAGIPADPPEFMKIYLEGLSGHGVPLPGAVRLLRKLKADHTVGVVTNGHGPVQRERLRASGLMEHIDLLVISCEVGHAKPDPEIVRYAMKLAGSETFSTLFVGDSAGSDMGAANAAGVDFVFVRPEGGFPGPGPRVLEVRSTGELADLL